MHITFVEVCLESSETKITNFDIEAIINEDIVRFDVSVYNSTRMDEMVGFGNISCNFQFLLITQFKLWHHVQQSMQRLINIFEYNEYIRHDWLDCHEEAYVWVSEYSLHHHFIVDFIE